MSIKVLDPRINVLHAKLAAELNPVGKKLANEGARPLIIAAMMPEHAVIHWEETPASPAQLADYYDMLSELAKAKANELRAGRIHIKRN